MTTPRLTIDQLRALERDPDTARLRAAITTAAAAAASLTAAVDAYLAPVFARFTFYADRLATDLGEPRRRITDPNDLYLSTDEAQCQAYFEACDAAHRAHGHQVDPGVCPAARARADLLRAQQALLVHIDRYTGMDVATAAPDLRDQVLAVFMDPPGRVAGPSPRSGAPGGSTGSAPSGSERGNRDDTPASGA